MWDNVYTYVVHIDTHSMSEQHSVYYSDDEKELANWVKKYEDVLGGRSDIYKRAMILLRKEHGEELEELSDDTGSSDVIV